MNASNRIQVFLSASCNSTPRADYLATRLCRNLERPLLTEEDIRVHAWLNERLMALQRERQSLWSRVVRLFLGSRLVP